MSDYGIKTYADLAETCGNMVLANEMAKRPLELVSGDWAPWEEIFQWYIICLLYTSARPSLRLRAHRCCPGSP